MKYRYEHIILTKDRKGHFDRVFSVNYESRNKSAQSLYVLGKNQVQSVNEHVFGNFWISGKR